MRKMSTRLGVMSELKKWSMYHDNERIIQSGSDEEFLALVEAGMAIIDNARKTGIDFDTKAYSGLYQSIDVDKISFSRLSALLNKFPAISNELKFYSGSNHDNRLLILEARVKNSNNIDFHVENIKQCFALSEATGSLKALLKSLEMSSEFLGGFDFYDEYVSQVLCNMMDCLAQYKLSLTQHKDIILSSAFDAFEPIRVMNPLVGSENLSRVLNSSFREFAEHIYPHCDIAIQSNNCLEEFFNGHDLSLSEERIAKLLELHKGDDNAFEYAIELTRLKFAKGDLDGYDKFFEIEWEVASEVLFYVNGCTKDASPYKASLESFSSAIFRNVDNINKLKPSTLSKLIMSLGKTDEGRVILGYAKSNRDASKYIISSELDI